MQLNSFNFILYFFPLFFGLYFCAKKISIVLGKWVIVLSSILYYYLIAGDEALLFLLLSIIVNYLFSFYIDRSFRPKIKKILFIVGVCFNLCSLGLFKYLDFTIENLNTLFGTSLQEVSILLPIGISFFSFQQIMYMREIKEGEIRLKLLDYLVFILYFPKLLMGPIAEPSYFLEQVNNNQGPNHDNIASGLKLFSFGLLKKMVLANTFSSAVNWGFRNFSVANSGDWILIILFYTFEIYFDFSGYIDMATGISSMINIRLPINFDSPYKSLSVREFWKRWHISLTNFLTKYIYYPLGGSKKGHIRTYINIFIVFLISGIWHGANWTFVIWGIIHATLQVTERAFEKFYQRIFVGVKWIYTFISVSLLWLLFRCESLTQWKNILKIIFSFGDLKISTGLLDCFKLPESRAILGAIHLSGISAGIRGFEMIVIVALSSFICLVPENNYKNMKKHDVLSLVLSIVAFIWAFVCLGSESTFIYNNF